MHHAADQPGPFLQPRETLAPLIAGGPEGAPSGTGALATSTTRLSGS
ncbi:hypothetical protein ACFQV4_04125 [Streptomyces thermocarboxydus]